MPISKSVSAVMTRSSYLSTVNTHVTNTVPKIEKVNHPQNSPAKSSQTSISKDTVHISQEARKAYESSTSIAAINPVRNTIGNTVYNPIDFIKREASRNLGNQTETALYNPVKSMKDALQAAFKPLEKDAVQMRKKEVQEASQQAQKSNDVKKAKEEALTRQIRLSLYNMDKDIRTVVGHNLSQNIYTASKNKSDKGWSATKELIDVLTDVVPGIGSIKDAYRLYQVLSNPKSNAKDVAEALVGFIPGLGDLKSIAKVTNAIKKALDVDPKKLDQAVSIIKGTGNARPSWRQSEIDIGKEYPEYSAQKSFKNGKEVPYGTKGSSRPDFYREGFSIEVKNYKITTPSDRNRLVNNISTQVEKRLSDLPRGTKQTVIIDIRGQNVSEEILDDLYDRIMKKTNGKVNIRFKTNE